MLLVWPVLLLLVTTLTAATPDLSKQPQAHWPTWRGPTGQGYVDADRVPLTWSETENVLWKTVLPGVGNSSPIIWGDRIFLTSSRDNGAIRTVFCVSATNGKILWQDDVAKEVAKEPSH